jgi:hypothetical protein
MVISGYSVTGKTGEWGSVERIKINDRQRMKMNIENEISLS